MLKLKRSWTQGSKGPAFDRIKGLRLTASTHSVSYTGILLYSS